MTLGSSLADTAYEIMMLFSLKLFLNICIIMYIFYVYIYVCILGVQFICMCVCYSVFVLQFLKSLLLDDSKF